MICPVCNGNETLMLVVKVVEDTTHYRVKFDGSLIKSLNYKDTVEVTAYCDVCDTYFDDHYLTLEYKDDKPYRLISIECF